MEHLIKKLEKINFEKALEFAKEWVELKNQEDLNKIDAESYKSQITYLELRIKRELNSTN